MSEGITQTGIVKQFKDIIASHLKGEVLSRFNDGKTGMVMRKTKSGGTRREEKLANSIKGNVHYVYGDADGIIFRYERHGIFVKHGVGRGYKMSDGMVTKYSKNPDGHRNAVDWATPVLDRDVPVFADKIGEVNADAAVKAVLKGL